LKGRPSVYKGPAAIPPQASFHVPEELHTGERYISSDPGSQWTRMTTSPRHVLKHSCFKINELVTPNMVNTTPITVIPLTVLVVILKQQ
jgi:hypothetical protein